MFVYGACCFMCVLSVLCLVCVCDFRRCVLFALVAIVCRMFVLWCVVRVVCVVSVVLCCVFLWVMRLVCCV